MRALAPRLVTTEGLINAHRFFFFKFKTVGWKGHRYIEKRICCVVDYQFIIK